MNRSDDTSSTILHTSQFQSRRSMIQASLAFSATAFLPASTGLTQELEPESRPAQAPTRPASTPDQPVLSLDGRSFEGPTGALGMDPHHSEVIAFNNGRMSSSECEQWGFMPGEYRAWEENGRVRFVARLISQRYGAIDWVGEIQANTVKAEYHWRKERLFWTLKNSYWFQGAARG